MQSFGVVLSNKGIYKQPAAIADILYRCSDIIHADW